MKFIKQFLNLESSTGIFLAAATIFAIVFKNSPWQDYYDKLINLSLNLSILELNLNKPLVIWVNDFLMAFFFLMIGLELKREILEGHLKTPKDCLLPGIAALGGIIFPAIIYVAFTYKHSDALRGWAIPAATDIAFAMGVLALLGSKIPRSLKIFLLSLAIFDDIAAILIIAAFYANKISAFWLVSSFAVLVLLGALNFKHTKSITPYMILGLLLWLCILKSGIHATISGILLGALIPLKIDPDNISPLKTLESRLHPWVSFIILPIFAFFNAGVPIKDLSLTAISHPIAIGIIAGLFLGKQLGVISFSLVAIKLNICRLPVNTTFIQFYGIAVLTGIGFTMSLFIGSLSFYQIEYQNIMRLGVITGSILSSVLGYCILLYSAHKYDQ